MHNRHGEAPVLTALRLLALASLGPSRAWYAHPSAKLIPNESAPETVALQSPEGVRALVGRDEHVHRAMGTILEAFTLTLDERNDAAVRSERLTEIRTLLFDVRMTVWQFTRLLLHVMEQASGRRPCACQHAELASRGPTPFPDGAKSLSTDFSTVERALQAAWKTFDALTMNRTNGFNDSGIEGSIAYRLLLQCTRPTRGGKGGCPPSQKLRVILTIGLLEFLPAVNEIPPLVRGLLYAMPQAGAPALLPSPGESSLTRSAPTALSSQLVSDSDLWRDRVREKESRCARILDDLIAASEGPWEVTS